MSAPLSADLAQIGKSVVIKGDFSVAKTFMSTVRWRAASP